MKVNPRFKLRTPKSKKPTSIQLVLFYKGHRFSYGTGLSIEAKLWDSDNERPTKDYEVLRRYKKVETNVQARLEALEGELSRYVKVVKDYFVKCRLEDRIPNPKDIKPVLDFKFGRVVDDNTNLNGFIGQFIANIESGERLTVKGTRYAKGTIKNYKGFEVQFKEYQKKSHSVIDFNDIDDRFYKSYINFFNDKGYTPNTIGRHVKAIKVIMRASAKLGLHSNNNFEDFKSLTADTTAVYLTETERTTIYNLEVKESLQVAKDLFMIGCFSGLRYSDLSRIRPHHVKELNGKTVIDIKTTKTGHRVVIPVGTRLKKILDHYDKRAPFLVEQQLNKKIKEIGKIAGLDEPITKEIIKGGVKMKTQVSKYEMLTSHSGRRTALTLMYLAKIPTIAIKKISGHKTEKSFLKYIKVSDEENAILLGEHEYFNRTEMKVV